MNEHKSWAAPKRGQLPPPVPLLPPGDPPSMKNVDGDKVLSGNHTHAKVWLIKHYFCKKTQTSDLLAFINIRNAGKFANVQKLSVSASGRLRHLLPLNRATSFWCTQQLNKVNIWPTQQKIIAALCSGPHITPTQLQIPSATHDTSTSSTHRTDSARVTFLSQQPMSPKRDHITQHYHIIWGMPE